MGLTESTGHHHAPANLDKQNLGVRAGSGVWIHSGTITLHAHALSLRVRPLDYAHLYASFASLSVRRQKHLLVRPLVADHLSMYHMPVSAPLSIRPPLLPSPIRYRPGLMRFHFGSLPLTNFNPILLSLSSCLVSMEVSHAPMHHPRRLAVDPGRFGLLQRRNTWRSRTGAHNVKQNHEV